MATLVAFTFLLVALAIVSAVVYLSTTTPYLSTCPPGECATNIFNGEKTCPTQLEERVPREGYQVCLPPYSCKSPLPYAVLPYSINGEITDSLGRCPEGEVCPCSRTAYCADYITTYFTVIGASPYENILNTSATVRQNTSYINALEKFSSFPPLALPEDSFCSIPPRWYSRLYPKTCLRGTLYYLTPEISNFNPLRDPLACIKEEPCTEGTPVLETTTGKIYCL